MADIFGNKSSCENQRNRERHFLNELEKCEKGKKIYLYTDNAYTYQFYEHCGIKCVGEKNVILELGKKHGNFQQK